ncbi:MAG: hypothetical protein K2P70_05745 [Hyphomonadaceae bacterium]|nr:hypothetical protein [Hyphomonadaceae bacterium]
MTEPAPPQDRFWVSLVNLLLALAVIWGGAALIMSAPMGANDWVGIGPLFIVPGVFLLFIGVVLVVTMLSRKSQD